MSRPADFPKRSILYILYCMGILTKLFGSKQEKDTKQLSPIVDKINSLEGWAKGLKTEDFPSVTQNFKERLNSGETLDEILPEAFALAREASFRMLGQRHYDVQLMGAIVLHQGKILEMKTGEGKTLTCVPAAYLHALEGKGVHVVTVNDYLAKRDCEWMSPIYNALGLTTGVILNDMDNERRRIEYAKDITYGTNNEFGFDYLRDNMKHRQQDKIQPLHHFCIIDEIDSILIDEARTPLIISGQAEDDSTIARNAARIAPLFRECEKDPETGKYPEEDPLARFSKDPVPELDGDFKIDEKTKNITFTKQGMVHMEEMLVGNKIITGTLYDDENFEFIHYVTQAVKALYCYKKDIDYIVDDGEIKIVDEFTGRVLAGRRYSEGLHQAIEAKENIQVRGRSRTLATITLQNFFRMYDKISGMTGTAETEAPEFMSIYGLDVVVIPTNLPVIRKDNNDAVFFNEQYKLQAICTKIKELHEKGQPVLVGTISIEKSELLSSLIRRMGIPHEVLNAKNHAREALIISEAGSRGAVTIATNMAGRGTDIKLGGSIENMAYKLCGTEASPEELAAAIEKVRPEWQKRYEEVKSLGGLYILGTERHESRRIDNQLRGRSGRQGDPGESCFFLSLDDDLMRLFAKDNIRGMLKGAGMDTPDPISHPLVTKAIERAQKTVEERNFEIRKHLLEYDDVLNEQRNFIYSQRDSILQDEHIIDRVLRTVRLLCDGLKDEENISDGVRNSFAIELTGDFSGKDNAEIADSLYNALEKNLREKENLGGPALFNEFLRFQYLRNIDARWQDHLEQLEALRDSVSLRTFAQKNPLIEYKLEGSDIFDEMLYNIRAAVAKAAVRVQISAEPVNRAQRRSGQIVERHAVLSNFDNPNRNRVAGNMEGQQGVQIKRTMPKVGRNDPCPCGSGKKYKNCHGRNLGNV